MTLIQITRLKRNLSYLELSHKMTFLLPAVYGTGATPVAGLDAIVASYPDGFATEVVPVTGTVITFTETVSVPLTVTLAQAKTSLQNKYATIRAKLDGLTLDPLDRIAGLSWDGTTWT